MTTSRIMDLVNLASDAALDAAAAGTRATTSKAAAVAEAERIRLDIGGSADRFTSEQGLGVLRLDGANKPAVPRIEKPAEFASWLAERHPQLVQATITVPADQLEAALKAIEFAQITTVSAEAQPKTEATLWMTENCRPFADPDSPGDWLVRAATDNGYESVPGVGATQPAPTWVLTANSDLKKARAQASADQAREQVKQLVEPAAAVGSPAPDPGPEPITYVDLATLSRDDLVAQCKSAGLGTSGTKAALAARLNTALT
jgi:hypothetical protein